MDSTRIRELQTTAYANIASQTSSTTNAVLFQRFLNRFREGPSLDDLSSDDRRRTGSSIEEIPRTFPVPGHSRPPPATTGEGHQEPLDSQHDDRKQHHGRSWRRDGDQHHHRNPPTHEHRSRRYRHGRDP